MNTDLGRTSQSEDLSWWRPVWICLAGEQPMPNVLPILPKLPEKVVFMHTEMPASREAAERCAKFLAARGVDAQTHLTDAYDATRVSEDVASLATQNDLGKVLLNYTGGTKVMSLAAYQAVPPHIPKIYFDSRKGLMVNQGLFQSLAMPPLSVMDILALHADVEADSTAFAPPPAPATSAILAEVFARDPRVVTGLMTYRDKVLKPLRKGRAWLIPTESLPLPLEKQNANLAASMAKAMRSDGLLQPLDGFCPNQNGLLLLEGFWWEHLVECRLRAGFDALRLPMDMIDIRTNLTVRWKAARTNTPNEFDLAFVFQNRLYLVSCTSASESETEKRRSQVEAFAERLGGHFAKAMVASTLLDDKLDKLKARGSSRLLLPGFKEWMKPERLLRTWLEIPS